MYPRNAASPEPIAIGPVVQISDGAVQTSGVLVRIKPIGVAEANGTGATNYSTDGIVEYTPVQSETDYTSFILIAGKAGCIPAAITVITSASVTPGHAGLDWSKVINQSSTVDLSATDIQLCDSVTLTATTTNLTNLPSIPANWITAAGITASALDGKGDWNTVEPLPAATDQAEHDATQASISALNNVAATDIVTGGAITTSGGAVTTVTNLTNLPSIPANWITAAGINAGAITSGKFGNGAITSTVFADGTLTAAKFSSTAGQYGHLGIVDQGTAVSATATTLVLRAAATFVDNSINGSWIMITGGTTGVGQVRRVKSYVGATDTATVDTWTTTPTGTITYKIFAAPPILDANVLQVSGTTQTARDLGASVLLSSGTGTGQISLTSGAVTVGTNNDKTGYALSAAGVDAIWDELLAGHGTAGSAGEALSAAGTAGDPWLTDLSTYTGVQAGKLVSDIYADTNELQLNQGNWLTAFGFATPTNVTDAQTAIQTDISNLNDFDPVLDPVAVVTSVTNTVSANLVQVLGTGISESSAGRIAGNFDVFFDNVDVLTTKTLDDVGGDASVTLSNIADAVWDELLAGHVVAGSTGEALTAAGTAGDPWIADLPGSYTGIQAGKILGDLVAHGDQFWSNACPVESYLRNRDIVDFGIGVSNPTAVPNIDDDDLIHIAYRKTGNSLQARSYRMSTGEYTAEVELRSSGVDPHLLWRPDGFLTAYYSNGGTSVYHRGSPDSGATFNPPVLALTDVSGDGGHYEDVHAVVMPNGNVLVTAEWEVVDKGESAIDYNIWDGASWGTQVRLIAKDGTTDYESPEIFVDNGNVYLLTASNVAGGNTYEDNVLMLYTSTDNAVTWDSGRVILSQKSNVEYEYFKHGENYYIASCRNYDGTDLTAEPGVYKLGTTLTPKRLQDNGWAQDFGTIIVGDGYVDLNSNNNQRGMFVRDVPDGSDVDVTFTDISCNGTTTADIRILFAYTDSNTHYMWLLNAAGAQMYKKVGASYTIIGSLDAVTIALGTNYDVRVVFDGVGNTQDLYVDGVLISSNTDATYTTGKVGFGCGQEATNPLLRQPIRCGQINVEGQWLEDWTGYATFTPLGTKGAIKFAGPIFQSGGITYVVLEDRTDDVLTLYQLVTEEPAVSTTCATSSEIYDYFTSGTNEDVFKATGFATPTNVTDSQTAIITEINANETKIDLIETKAQADSRQALLIAEIDANEVKIDGIDTNVLAVKAKTDQFVFTVPNQVDANALTGGGGDDAATIYTYFTAGANEDAFKASGFATPTDVTNAQTAIIAEIDANEVKIDGIKSTTDQFVFTVANQVDANALTGGGGDDAATIYTYFTSGANEDVFKADISGLPTVNDIWDEPAASHLGVGTLGALQSVDHEFDTIWDALLSNHQSAGSFGEYLGAGLAEAAVWDQNLASHVIVGSTGEALATASSAGDPWNTNVPGAYAAGTAGYILGTNLDQPLSSCCSLGAGAISVPFTIQSEGVPVSEVKCWVTTDIGGANVVAGTLLTDDFGDVVFLLDAGTYYLWRDSSKACFPNPVEFTVV